MYDSAQNEIDLISMKNGDVQKSSFQATEEKKAAAAQEINRFEESISAALARAQAEWNEE